MTKRTVADYIWEYLSENGVDTAFLLPGGGCMYLVDALARNGNIKAVPMLHEQSVGIAAEAYAQYTNQIGAALVTTGPGGTNAVTACAAAWTDSTPVIFISGQVRLSHLKDGSRLRQRGFQEIPIVEIVTPITKKAVSVRSAQQAISAVHELCEVAISGRPGPVWLDVPLDIQNAEIDGFFSENTNSVKQTVDLDVNIDRLSNILEIWKKSKRPMILAGNGIRTSGSLEHFRNLVPKLKTPIMLTWKAIDFLDENNELNAGRPGSIAQPWANLSVQNADFVLILAARMDMGQLAYKAETFSRGAFVVMVDIDDEELNKFQNLNWELVNADLKVFLRALDTQVEGVHLSFPDWIDEISRLKAEFPLPPKSEIEHQEGISNYLFLDALSNQLDTGDLIVPGSSGACSEITMQAFKVKIGQRVFNSEALGPMGFGIPAAIGANFASKGRRTICVDGDGGFVMNIQELSTIAGHGLNVKFFIQNNNGYESIRTTQDNLFDGRHLGIDGESGIFIPNFEKVAKAFGIPYFRITHNDQIDTVLRNVLNLVGPSITELFISKESRTLYKVNSYIKESGEIDSYPLEDMSPPIPLDRLREIVRPTLLNESINRRRD
jgi:acetolactate synthase I/II/III large subunit